MPYIVRSPMGLQCLLCNGSSDETINSSKWALRTASLSRKRGEAEQHVSHGKHLQAFNAAKLTPSLRHLLPIAAIHPWHRTTISGSKFAICAANWQPPLEWGPWCAGSAPKERHLIDAHAASATHQCWLPPIDPVARADNPPAQDPPRSIPGPVQRATVNCYAKLHAGKGRKFYNRLCHLDGIKAKDGQRNYSSGSGYERLRALIVAQGRWRTRNRVLRARKVAIVLDVGARRGPKSEPLADFMRTPEEEIFGGLDDMMRPQGREGVCVKLPKMTLMRRMLSCTMTRWTAQLQQRVGLRTTTCLDRCTRSPANKEPCVESKEGCNCARCWRSKGAQE